MTGRRAWRLAWPWLLAVGLTAIAGFPAWLHPLTSVPGDQGDPLLNTWILAWVSHALSAGVSIWNANAYYPLPGTLTFNEHLFSLAVLTVPVQAAGEPLLAYNVSFLGSFVLAFMGAFLLAARVWGSGTAGMLAGVVYAFGAYRLSLIAHLQLLSSQWLPFALCALEGYIARPSWRRLLAVALFLLLSLATSWYMAVFSAAAVSGWCLLSLATGRWRLRREHLGLAPALAVASLAVLGLALPYGHSLAMITSGRGLAQSTSFSLRPIDLLTAAPANLLWGRASAAMRSAPGFNDEHSLYLGWCAVGLALAGLLRTLPRVGQRALAITAAGVGAVCLVLSLGPEQGIGGRSFSLPWGWALSVLPALQAVRVPVRWFIPLTLCLALLAGAASRQRRAAIGLAVLCFLEGASLPLPLAPVPSLARLPSVYAWLAQAPRGGVIELPLWVAPQPEYPEAKRLYASTEHWLPLVNGYSGLTPERQRQLASEMQAFPDARSLAELRQLAEQGVKYLIVHPGEGNLSALAWEREYRWELAALPWLHLSAVAPGAWLYAVDPSIEADLRTGAGASAQFVPCRVAFANGTDLLGYHWQPNGPLGPTLALFWRAPAVPAPDRTVFVHMIGSQGQVLSQADGDPVGGHLPLSDWAPSALVRDEHLFPEAPAGGVAFAVGWYDRTNATRVPCTGPGTRDDAAILPIER